MVTVNWSSSKSLPYPPIHLVTYILNILRSLSTLPGLDINLFWDLSCLISEGNFHLSEKKIHLPTFFVWFSLAGFSVPTTAFRIKRVQILLVLSDKWSGKFSYFQLSRAVGQSLMSIPVYTQQNCASQEISNVVHIFIFLHRHLNAVSTLTSFSSSLRIRSHSTSEDFSAAQSAASCSL